MTAILILLSSFLLLIFIWERWIAVPSAIADSTQPYNTFLLFGPIDAPVEERRGSLLFVWKDKPYFLLFSLRKETFIKENNEQISLFLGDATEVSKRVEKIYEHPINLIIAPTQKQIENIIEISGGTIIFNTKSNHLKKGEVFLDHLNYQNYLLGIEDLDQRENERKAFWFHLMNEMIKKQLTIKDHYPTYTQIFDNLNMNSNIRTFRFFHNAVAGYYRQALEDKQLPLKQISEISPIYFKSLRGNLQSKKENGKTFLVPYLEGKYDSSRISNTLKDFFADEPPLEKYPIIVQVRNTTSINRLAARTSGVLRLKKINVLEYRNSIFKLDESVIIDYSLSPIKRDHISRVTGVKKIYPGFNHRENFDFSLYLGYDYYAIKFFKE